MKPLRSLALGMLGMATALSTSFPLSRRREEDEPEPRRLLLKKPDGTPDLPASLDALEDRMDRADRRLATYTLTNPNRYAGVTVPTYRRPLSRIPGGNTPEAVLQAQRDAAVRQAKRTARGQLRGRKQPRRPLVRR